MAVEDHPHEFASPLEAAKYSLQRASEVQFEPISGAPQLDKPPPGDALHGWPDVQSRDEFALALLTDAVRHCIKHLDELDLRVNAIDARSTSTYVTQVSMLTEAATKAQNSATGT